jgi:hypothetical protein
MEPISAVASIVTVLALVKEISVLTADLFCGLHSAPAELARLLDQTNLIAKQLQCFERDTGQSEIDQLLDSSEISTLCQALEAAKSNISAIHKDCENLGRRSKWRLIWTLYEKKKAGGYLKHLQNTESSLGVVLQITNL